MNLIGLIKKKKRISILVAALGVIILIGIFYTRNFTSAAIMRKVKDGDGYLVSRSDTIPVVKLFIEPEWIPWKGNEETKLNKVLDEEYDTKIMIKNIIHRDDDIYVTLDIQHDLNYQKGEFLYNYTFEGDGWVTPNMTVDGIKLYNMENTPIDVGQKGIGPGGSIGFGINKAQYELIKNGFYAEYSDYYLYQYVKVE